MRPFKGERALAQANDQKARLIVEPSAFVRLTGFARAVRLLDIALFERHADPGQRQSDQRVANHYQKRQHRPLPQCSKRYVRASWVNRNRQRHRIALNDESSTTDYASSLDREGPRAMLRVMLQHNSARAGRQAHLAHGAVMGIHVFCCGLPALALLLAAASGATSGATLLPDSMGKLHELLHQHEIWILAVSAALVVTGGWFEVKAQRHHRHGFPWLFAFSVLCFLTNVTIILVHRAT
ncbi:MAG: hypothetical protein ACT4OF_06700 [Caulobacteraceae bacterium]